MSARPGAKTPIRGTLLVCCACVASGKATAQPVTTLMKSRRLIAGSGQGTVSGRVGNVRFGSQAGMCSAKRHVRFTPNSDCKSGPHKVMSALPPKADIALRPGGLGVDTGRQTQGPAATIAFNFSPKLFRGSDQPSSFFRKLRANSGAHDSKIWRCAWPR